MLIRRRTVAAALLTAQALGADAALAPVRDRAFWRRIVESRYQVPAGETADGLVVELAEAVGSPDPELRDDFGYSIAAAWIYRDRRVSEKTLRQLLETWSRNLQAGLGSTGTDAVFRRSFSALDLSILAALDNEHPFLQEKEAAALLSSTLAYLAGEKDLRAYDARTGWMHATAHTADVLKFLGRSRHLRPADQKRILDTIAAKLSDAGQVFAHGENERLAAAVMSLVRREDFDRAAFTAFLAALAAPAEHLWDKGPLVDPGRYAATQNAKDLLRSLYVKLALAKASGSAVEPSPAEILRTLEKLGA
jgi:hypothetical protein